MDFATLMMVVLGITAVTIAVMVICEARSRRGD